MPPERVIVTVIIGEEQRVVRRREDRGGERRGKEARGESREETRGEE